MLHVGQESAGGDELSGSTRTVTGCHRVLGSEPIVTACRAHLSAALLWWLGFVAPAAAAESFPLVLEYLTTADGLPQGTVYATLQDSQGFVWLATEDGLVRYDGHELFRYAYSRSARGGLPGNYIQAIVEDAQ